MWNNTRNTQSCQTISSTLNDSFSCSACISEIIFFSSPIMLVSCQKCFNWPVCASFVKFAADVCWTIDCLDAICKASWNKQTKVSLSSTKSLLLNVKWNWVRGKLKYCHLCLHHSYLSRNKILIKVCSHLIMRILDGLHSISMLWHALKETKFVCYVFSWKIRKSYKTLLHCSVYVKSSKLHGKIWWGYLFEI